jgi:hypothetical protein
MIVIQKRPTSDRSRTGMRWTADDPNGRMPWRGPSPIHVAQKLDDAGHGDHPVRVIYGDQSFDGGFIVYPSVKWLSEQQLPAYRERFDFSGGRHQYIQYMIPPPPQTTGEEL